MGVGAIFVLAAQVVTGSNQMPVSENKCDMVGCVTALLLRWTDHVGLLLSSKFHPCSEKLASSKET